MQVNELKLWVEGYIFTWPTSPSPPKRNRRETPPRSRIPGSGFRAIQWLGRNAFSSLPLGLRRARLRWRPSASTQHCPACVLTRLNAYRDHNPAPKAARIPRRKATAPPNFAPLAILRGSMVIAAAPLMATSVARSHRDRLPASFKPSWKASTIIGMKVSAASRLDARSSLSSSIAYPVGAGRRHQAPPRSLN